MDTQINCCCCKEMILKRYSIEYEDERYCAPCYGSMIVIVNRLEYFHKHKKFSELAKDKDKVPKAEL